MTEPEPDAPDSLKWLGGWPENPDAPMPGRVDFRRFHLMEAAKMYLDDLAVLETVVSEELHPGCFLDVTIKVRVVGKDGANETGSPR